MENIGNIEYLCPDYRLMRVLYEPGILCCVGIRVFVCAGILFLILLDKVL